MTLRSSRIRASAPRGPRAPAAVPVALALGLVVGLAGCGGPGEAATPAGDDDARGTAVTATAGHDGHGATTGHGESGSGADHSGHGSQPELGADEPAGFSIYHAESVWTDQAGRERTLGSLAGRVQVVAMVYTSCAYACPRIMLDMKRIEGDLGPDLAGDVGFVLVTIDPERDTPERLAEFARGSRLGPEWTLLTADEGDILELAALLGVQYRETAPGEFVHSNLISVLDADGQVVHRQLGLGTDPAATLDVIRGLTD